MSENEAKAPQFADDDWRSQVELHPDEDGYPRWDESGEGIWVKPNPETQCGNCNNRLEPGDKYCRLCGTKKGEGAYEPYFDTLVTQCVYGPMPVERTHSCSKCGYSWTTCLMTDRQEYCPMCGGFAPPDDWPYYL